MPIERVPDLIRVQKDKSSILEAKNKKLDDLVVTFSPLKGDINVCMSTIELNCIFIYLTTIKIQVIQLAVNQVLFASENILQGLRERHRR